MPAYRQNTVRFQVGENSSRLVIARPPQFTKTLIIANGAGANMDHPFLKLFWDSLAKQGYATVRFNFFYHEAGRKSPDAKGKLESCYLKVIETLVEKQKMDAKSLVLGGKSMGGRIATQIANQTAAKRIVLFGYPLHAPGQPGKLRDAHLYDVKATMLFLQGERDKLCDLSKLRPIVNKLGKKAKIHVIPNGDHSLAVPKKNAVSQEDVYAECTREIKRFIK